VRVVAARLARRTLTPLRIRAVRDGFSVLGLLALAWAALFAPGADVHTYWSFDVAHPYGAVVGTADAFLYSPVAALVALPFHALPFGLVRLLLMALDVICLVYLAGAWAIALIALPPVLGDVATGNIHILLAAAIALGFRYPATWSFVLLSKVTPGVGLLWFAVRREWRSLVIALAVTACLALCSLVLVPGWWPAWFAVLSSSSGMPVTAPVLTDAPLVFRVLLAAAVVAWGARAGQAWTVPLGAMIALPELWVMGTSVFLGALPWLRARYGAANSHAAQPAPGASRRRPVTTKRAPGERAV
jgi:Glycosyltransferase family 87